MEETFEDMGQGGILVPVVEGYGRHSQLVVRLAHEYSENNVAVLGII